LAGIKIFSELFFEKNDNRDSVKRESISFFTMSTHRVNVSFYFYFFTSILKKKRNPSHGGDSKIRTAAIQQCGEKLTETIQKVAPDEQQGEESWREETGEGWKSGQN